MSLGKILNRHLACGHCHPCMNVSSIIQDKAGQMEKGGMDGCMDGWMGGSNTPRRVHILFETKIQHVLFTYMMYLT